MSALINVRGVCDGKDTKKEQPCLSEFDLTLVTYIETFLSKKYSWCPHLEALHLKA